MKSKWIAGFLICAVGFIPPVFGSLKDCQALHKLWPDVMLFYKQELASDNERLELRKKHGFPSELNLALFRTVWHTFVADQSPDGPQAFENALAEMNAEDAALFNYGMEIMIGNWLEANPATTSLTADECLFEALKEPLGLKELR